MGLFRSFFDAMNSEPKVIMTDQQIAIIGALEELKERGIWEGTHLLDTFHILKNLRKKSKNKELVNILHEAMFEESPSRYHYLL